MKVVVGSKWCAMTSQLAIICVWRDKSIVNRSHVAHKYFKPQSTHAEKIIVHEEYM